MLSALDKKRRNEAMRSLRDKNEGKDGLTGITAPMYYVNTIQQGNLLNKWGKNAVDSTLATNYANASTPSLPMLTTLSR